MADWRYATETGYYANDGTGYEPTGYYESMRVVNRYPVEEVECEYCGVPLRGDRKCMSCGAPARVKRHKDTSIDDAFNLLEALNG